MTADAETLLGHLRSLLGERAAQAADPRVTVGPRAVCVTCTHPEFGNLSGVAHRPDADWRPAAAPDTVDAALASTQAEAGSVERAVGLATANALSVPDVPWREGDPMAALSPDVDVVATVGLFRPAFRKFADVEVRVVERAAVDAGDVAAPDGVRVRTFTPDQCAAAVDGADVCFVTGATLVYGGVDDYLAATARAGVPLTVLVGATASFLPAPAFEVGVDLLAGARVDDVASVRERIAAGDCGTELHDAGLTKVYVAAGAVPGVEFAATDSDGNETDQLTASDTNIHTP